MSSTIQSKKKKEKNKNDNLHKAKSAKNDEFYTTRGTIENELKWYKHHFKGKVVYCNCDDPYESEFFKYFMLQFKMLGLKKLIATCYKNSPVANKQFQFFSNEELLTNRGNKAHKIEITSEDLEGENPSMENMKDILKRKKLVKNLPAKCDGSFDSKPCLKLLEEADIVVTNPPFSQFRQFVHVLEKYHKDFLIIGNKNAITYKEIFPLIKENKMWLGYSQPKEFFNPNGELTKKLSGLTRWYTNLDIPKRHENLDLWKHYSPKDYPHYDNYDAINVDKVSEIPKDYCESWGLYSEEYKALDKTQWEEVRREQKDDTELIYVIPAKDTELRQALHDHSDRYKEKIEHVLAKSIYCSGCMGVPITMLDKYNPEQLEIVNPLDVSVDKPQSEPITANAGMQECRNANSCTWSRRMACQRQTQVCSNLCPQDIVMESSECQSHSLTSGTQNNSVFLETNTHSTSKKEEDTSKENVCIAEFLSARYCNGIMGVPITFMDKHNPSQFKIIGQGQGNLYRQLTSYGLSQQFVDDYYKSGQKGSIKENHPVLGYYDLNNKPVIPYMRIVIQKII